MESFLFLKRARKGFTLIELIIVTAIIIAVTAITLSGQSGFNRTLALNNAAYNIALSIHLAQSYGLSSKLAGGAGNAGYGVQFDGGSPNSYIFFADTAPAVSAAAAPDAHSGDGHYSGAVPADQLVQTYNLNNGFRFTKFCAGSSDCWPGSISALAVSFVRPNTETVITAQKSSAWSAARYASACLTVSSPDNDARYVRITRNGQISTASSCP